jgi:phage-related baseplate assembly protein
VSVFNIEPKIFFDTSCTVTLDNILSTFHDLYPEYQLLESDPVMMSIRLQANREVMIKTAVNKKLKEMLPQYATGADLDNYIFGFYGGMRRLLGEEPTAIYQFKLTAPLSLVKKIPKGLQLEDEEGNGATLLEEILIQEGETEGYGLVKLEQKTEKSDLNPEEIVTPISYLKSAKLQEPFLGGADVESDEAFLNRAMFTFYKYSTAGSKHAYKYHAFKADGRVEDVFIDSKNRGEVCVYIKTSGDKSVVKKSVDSYMQQDNIRAFTDKVIVENAIEKSIDITARVTLFDILKQENIGKKIEENLQTSYKIDEDLPLSLIYEKMHAGGVYQVNLDGIEQSILTKKNEYIVVANIKIDWLECGDE